MSIKKSPYWESNHSRPHCRQTSYQLNFRGEHKGAYYCETYEETAKKVENQIVLKRNTGVSTPNILASKLEEGPLPYCRAGAESEGNNRSGHLASSIVTYP
jgi:hypothetical protein